MNVRRTVLIPGEDCDQITFMTAYLHSITHPLGFGVYALCCVLATTKVHLHEVSEIAYTA
jgi:hypothetical protein